MKTLIAILLLLFLSSHSKAELVTSGVLFGDSFSNNTVDWPTFAGTPFVRFASGGRSLGNVASNFTTELNTVDQSNYDGILVMVGINDVFGNVDLATMQSNMNSVIAQAPADKRLILATLPPALGHSSWSASKQVVLEDYNLWLKTLPFAVFDLNAVLDSDGDNQIDSQWNAGDQLHPTSGEAGGMGYIASRFDTFNAVPEPSSFVMFITGALFFLRRSR